MADDNQRIAELEKQVKELQGTVRPGPSPVLWVAMGVAFLVFVACVREMPFPGDPEGGERFGIGFLALLAGVFICGGALELVETAFKALVESAMAALLLFNGLAGAVLWMYLPDLVPMIAALENVPDDKAKPVLLFMGAVALFVVDTLAMLVLYPLAKVAGTQLG